MNYKLQEPLNAEERYLYEINVRLNVLIEMFSSFLDAYADANNYGTTNALIQTNIDIPESEEIEEEMDFSVLTKAEIMTNLDAMGIEYKSTMLKAELIELLKE